MSAIPLSMIGLSEASTIAPKLHEPTGHYCSKRVEELKARIEVLRAQLKEAEDELEREGNRVPDIGDFVRCPLTGFFGQVTKVTPRPHGRPWVEILLYLGEDLPGHAQIDLFGNWEVIDRPGQAAL
ncbi:hypothetical protein [Microvirga sp. P5_D2]